MNTRLSKSERRRTTLRAAALLLPLALASAACGAPVDTQADQPDRTSATFLAGDVVTLPRPAASVSLGDPVVDAKTTTQSYKVVGLGAQQVVYETELPMAGWKRRGVPAEAGDGDWRGVWARNDEMLQVSVSRENDNGTVISQLDLVLTR